MPVRALHCSSSILCRVHGVALCVPTCWVLRPAAACRVVVAAMVNLPDVLVGTLFVLSLLPSPFTLELFAPLLALAQTRTGKHSVLRRLVNLGLLSYNASLQQYSMHKVVREAARLLAHNLGKAPNHCLSFPDLEACVVGRQWEVQVRHIQLEVLAHARDMPTDPCGLFPPTLHALLQTCRSTRLARTMLSGWSGVRAAWCCRSSRRTACCLPGWRGRVWLCT